MLNQLILTKKISSCLLLIIVCLPFFTQVCFAQEQKSQWISADLHLNLVFSPHKDTAENVEKSKIFWAETCPTWGNSFLHSNNLFGSGVFKSYACYAQKTFVSGMIKKSYWLLNVRQKEDKVVIAIFFVRKPAPHNKSLSLKYYKIDKLVFDGNFFTAKAFTSSKFIYILSYYFLLSLPMMYNISKDLVQSDTIYIKDNKSYIKDRLYKEYKDTLRQPNTLSIFRLKYEKFQKYFYQNVVSLANLSLNEELIEKEVLNSDTNLSKFTRKNEYLAWKLEESQKKLMKIEGSIFGHDAEISAMKQKSIEEIVRTVFEEENVLKEDSAKQTGSNTVSDKKKNAIPKKELEKE